MSVILKHKRMLPAEVAAQVIPISHVRSAQVHASRVLPESVSSLLELHLEIERYAIPKFTEGEHGERLVSFYCDRHDSVILSVRPVLELLRTTRILHADATYQAVPCNLAQQLFCLNGSWNDYVSFPSALKANYHQNFSTLEVVSLLDVIVPLCFTDGGCRLRIYAKQDYRGVQGSV